MFEDLNEKQKEAVFSGDGPLLIVAGAGSGKTKTLTSRILYFIAEKKIEPARILAITFTNRAADEMKSRVLAALKKNRIPIHSEPHLSTFHSFGAFVLRDLCGYAGREKSFSIYDSDDAGKVLRDVLKDRNIQKGKGPGFFSREISRIKSELLDPDSFDGEGIVWEVFEAYEAALKKNNAFDFDDLIEKVVRIFRAYPEALKKYQRRYTHLLVDEYQDVNTAQYWMLKLLAGSHQHVTVVGDDAQSIYKFRFSDFRNFLNFETNWPDAKVVLLEQNYRSSGNIIKTSSDLIARNIQQKKKNLWTQRTEGTPVQVLEHSDAFEEADFIVSSAQKLREAGKHIGILYRTNAQSRALEQMLIEQGVAYRLFGAVSFYERKEIKDVLFALRYAHNPSDGVSLERLKKNLYKKDFVAMQEALPRKALELSPSKLVTFFLEEVSYSAYLRSEFVNFTERIENVQELVYFAEQFGELSELLEKIALVDAFGSGRRKTGSRFQGGHTIDLMTIHLAKGLEFDGVFVAGVNEGILPHNRAYFSDDELEEERRLLYVAMTRAKEHLYLCFYRIPSRFLFELPGDRIVFHTDRPLDDDERYIEYE